MKRLNRYKFEVQERSEMEYLFGIYQHKDGV